MAMRLARAAMWKLVLALYYCSQDEGEPYQGAVIESGE